MATQVGQSADGDRSYISVEARNAPGKDFAHIWTYDPNLYVPIGQTGEIFPDLFLEMIENPVVKGTAATHLRDNDVVIGLTVEGVHRAYPWWILDNCHSYNDLIGNTPIFLNLCEACGVAEAYVAIEDGERLIFRIRDLYNSTNMPRDQYGDPWSSLDGCCLHGPRKGHILARVPAYQMTWQDWQTLHPDTSVILPPLPGTYNHLDLRHGHGSEYYPGRPGVLDKFLYSIHPPGGFSDEAPENAIALGVLQPGDPVAFLLDDVKRAGGAINVEAGGEPIVVFAAPGDGFAMGAYSRLVGDRILTFHRDNQLFQDDQTGRHWTIDGNCVDNPSSLDEPIHLLPLDFVHLEFHLWPASHPTSRLWRPDNPPPVAVTDPELSLVFDTLREAGYAVEVDHQIINPQLPPGARVGYAATIAGESFLVFNFESSAEASDHVWVKRHALQVAHLALESDPPDQWIDSHHHRRNPEPAISWSPLLHDPTFHRLIQSTITIAKVDDKPTFAGFLGHLDRAGYSVTNCVWLIEGQLNPGAEAGLACRIMKNRFLVYRYPDAAGATAYAETLPSAIARGQWVLRSDPLSQYRTQFSINVPFDEVLWSPLLWDEDFVELVGVAAIPATQSAVETA